MEAATARVCAPAVAAQRSLADSLLGTPGLAGADGPVPSTEEVLQDARWALPSYGSLACGAWSWLLVAGRGRGPLLAASSLLGPLSAARGVGGRV